MTAVLLALLTSGGDPLKQDPKPEEKSFFVWTDTSLTLLSGDGFEVDPDEVLLGVGFDLHIREAGPLGLLGKFSYIKLNIYGRAELTEGVDLVAALVVAALIRESYPPKEEAPLGPDVPVRRRLETSGLRG